MRLLRKLSSWLALLVATTSPPPMATATVRSKDLALERFRSTTTTAFLHHRKSLLEGAAEVEAD
jgi:hypothetical protein